MSNRIIVPSNYTFEVIIKYDPNNGNSEMQIRNRSGRQITMWMVAGMLAEHVAHIMKTLLTQGKVQQTPVQEAPEEQPETKPEEPKVQ